MIMERRSWAWSRVTSCSRKDRKVQDVISLSRENGPISLGIVVDLSGSMATKMAKARAAVNEFLKNLEDDDEEFLVTFADRPELRLAFGSDPSAIRDGLLFATPRGSTALFDAVALAVRQMRQGRNRRKVLFLVSDGGDNHSRLTERELRRLIDEEDVQIHAIGIHDRSDRLDEARGPWILEDLAKMTGGQHHMLSSAAELPELAAKMSLALHERYVLGYRPNPSGLSGTFRKIEVKVVRGASAPRVWGVRPTGIPNAVTQLSSGTAHQTGQAPFQNRSSTPPGIVTVCPRNG